MSSRMKRISPEFERDIERFQEQLNSLIEEHSPNQKKFSFVQATRIKAKLQPTRKIKIDKRIFELILRGML